MVYWFRIKVDGVTVSVSAASRYEEAVDKAKSIAKKIAEREREHCKLYGGNEPVVRWEVITGDGEIVDA